MKHLPMLLAILLCGLTSCNRDSVSPIDDLTTRMTEQPDTINSPSISFNLGDTTMTEEIEDIILDAKDWEDEPMDVDL